MDLCRTGPGTAGPARFRIDCRTPSAVYGGRGLVLCWLARELDLGRRQGTGTGGRWSRGPVHVALWLLAILTLVSASDLPRRFLHLLHPWILGSHLKGG